MSCKISTALLLTTATAVLGAAMTWSTPTQAQEPYMGTIRYFGFNFAPRGWADCDGQLLAISQNGALFSLLGTIYGGDGRTTFALPDMRGRLPIGAGGGPGLTPRQQGIRGGSERVTLTRAQIGHGHTLYGRSGNGNQSTPTDNSLAKDKGDKTYRDEAPTVAMSNDSIGNTGGGLPHENRPPSLGVLCAIALTGTYPTRN
jgi:microcystin-dependent protein